MKESAFSRRELYELVWAHPVSVLAMRYGISGRGLAKACKRAGIPVPPRGYWAKVAAGHKTKQPPLPESEQDDDAEVRIRPIGPKPEPLPPPQVPQSVQAKIDEERKAGKAIHVPQTLANAHRLVAVWIERDEESKKEARVSPIMRAYYKPPSELTKRQWRIMSALFKAIEARGYKLSADSYYGRETVEIALGPERISVEFVERFRQYRRNLTEDEKRKSWATNQKWTQVREGTGELICKLKSSGSYFWSGQWQDLPNLPLESQINEVLAGIAGGFEAIRLERKKLAEEQHRQWKLQEEREELEEQRKREHARYRRLLTQVGNRERAARIRTFIAAMEAEIPIDAPAESRKAFDQWRLWAMSQADRIDPALDAQFFNMEVEDSEIEDLDD